MTSPTLAPILALSLLSVASRCRMLKSKPVPFCPARASPDSFSRTRLYLRDGKWWRLRWNSRLIGRDLQLQTEGARCEQRRDQLRVHNRTSEFHPQLRNALAHTSHLLCSQELLFAHLEANEPANLDVLPDLRRRFLDQFADGLLRLSHPRLVHQRDVLVVRLDLAGDDLLDQVIGLAALLDLLYEDALLLLDLVGRNLILVDRHRRCRRDVLGDVLNQFLERIGARDEVGLAVHFHQHAHLAVVMDVAADRALARLLADALLGLGDALGAEILDRLLHVAMVLLERSLRFHHTRAGALAQSLNILGRELLFCHCHVSYLVKTPPEFSGGVKVNLPARSRWLPLLRHLLRRLSL